MRRAILSLILGLALGALAGLVIGWLQPPAQQRGSSLAQLAQPHSDDYTVMVAFGYARDGDLTGAAERLLLLDIEQPAEYLQQTTERIIGSAARELDDIRALAKLAADLGGGSAAMAPFLDSPGQRG